MDKTVSSNKGRYLQLDILKGVAIFLVMTYHFFYRFIELYVPQMKPCFILSKWGVVGVTIFLSISGYLMFTSNEGGFHFLFRKLLRLWPTYIVAITICFIVTNIITLPERTVGVKEFVLNFFLINGFINVPYVDPAHWYITTLIGCIIVYSIVGLFPQASKWKVLSFCVIICTVLALSIDFICPASKVLSFILSLLGGRYLTMLVLGSAIRCIHESMQKTQGWVLALITVVCNTLMNSIGYSLILVVIGGCLFFLIKINNIPFGKNVFSELGKRSYSLFLIHQNIGFCLIYILSRKFEFSYMFSIITEIIMIVCGLVLYRLVENNPLVKARYIKK